MARGQIDEKSNVRAHLEDFQAVRPVATFVCGYEGEIRYSWGFLPVGPFTVNNPG